MLSIALLMAIVHGGAIWANLRCHHVHFGALHDEGILVGNNDVHHHQRTAIRMRKGGGPTPSLRLFGNESKGSHCMHCEIYK